MPNPSQATTANRRPHQRPDTLSFRLPAALRGGPLQVQTRRYVASVIHFGDWLHAEGYAASAIDEQVVARFLSEHLPSCTWRRPVSQGLITNRAALNHLIRLLRGERVIVRPAHDDVERELARFDASMMEVWGLSQDTRDHRRRIVRRLLRAQFGSGPILLGTIAASAVHAFVLGPPGFSPSTIRVMAGAVRCRLRHRQLLGDDVAALLKAVPRPACWHDAALPKALSLAELDQLFGAFNVECP
jgi:integrase/recombinase XerD